MKKRLCVVFAALMVVPSALLAQEKSPAQAGPPANPITASEKGFYSFVSGAVIGAAQKMPEENYSFKPTPEVRSFGQIVGHVADASYMFCSQSLGEPNPSKGIEKTKTAKADLVAALKESFAECDKAFDGTTDANVMEMTKGARPRSRIGTLVGNTTHDNEMYGAMAVYLRLKGIVPPSSEGR